jgi:hypothetical protein
MTESPGFAPAERLEVIRGYWAVRSLVLQLRRHAEEERKKEYVGDQLRDLLSRLQEEWAKLDDKLREKKMWQDVFRSGIILNSSLRSDFVRLDELYMAVRGEMKHEGDEIDQFMGKATSWGEQIDSTVGERKNWDDDTQDASDSHALGSEARSTVLSSHMDATV